MSIRVIADWQRKFENARGALDGAGDVDREGSAFCELFDIFERRFQGRRFGEIEGDRRRRKAIDMVDGEGAQVFFDFADGAKGDHLIVWYCGAITVVSRRDRDKNGETFP